VTTVALVAFAAAAAPPGPPPIINGEVERGWPSVVALGAGGFSICTGNLITPRVVLTAAHCQADLPFELIVAIGSIYIGTEAADPDHSLTLQSAAVHPDYRELSGAFLGENDVGVLVLDEDAPAEIEPIWIRTERFEKPELVGDVVTSVGFGLTETGGSGVKHSAPLVVSDLDPMFVLSESSGNENRANICSGDSGGPQFHERDGVVEQVAVHSWGDVNCQFNSGSTRTDVASDWILEQVEGVHGTTDFCEITARYGDGTCDPTCDQVDPDCMPSFADFSKVGDPRGCDHSGAAGAPALVAGAALMAARRRRSGSARARAAAEG
jgi:secreted trypsin-like serine protease